MKEKTLVILAAGQGSRFGGLKQLYPVGPNGEFIMDYSIYSAIKNGFTKIVFVIREEFLDAFNDTIGKRLDGVIPYSYVFQKIDSLPDGIKVPDGREKPWGTAHAFYCAKDECVGNVAVITADDFYGDEAFKDLSRSIDDDSYSVIGYKLSETMSDNGMVKRGVCMSNGSYVEELVESACVRENDHINCEPLNKSKKPYTVSLDHPVTMLMYGFTQEIFKTINNVMYNAFKENEDNLFDYEFYLPDIISLEIKNGKKVKLVETNSKWIGMTYKEDAESLKKYIEDLIEKNIYPKYLWK